MDPLADILAIIEAMDETTIAGLADNAEWRLRTKDLFPSDMDRIEEAVAERRRTVTKEASP
jgi:hypothetical protein